MTRVRAAVAQVRAAPGVQEAIEKVALLAHEAAAAGVQLVVFPEALLGGYPRGANFGAVIGERSPVGG